MERLAQGYRLKPGNKEEYIKAHREIWPEMLDCLRRAGCKQMSIFLRKDMLFMCADVEGIETFKRVVKDDPLNKKWQAWMAELLEQPFDMDEPGIFADLEEVWHFDALKI